MARNEVFISAAPDDVYGLLSDPASYRDWVVGASEIRGMDDHWPAPGAAFAHGVGSWPFVLRDETRVIDSEPPVMLKLRAKARPLPSATITFQLQPEGTGTRLTMIESPSHPLLSLLAGPVGHGVLAARNRETLRRLKELAEGLREPPSGLGRGSEHG